MIFERGFLIGGNLALGKDVDGMLLASSELD